MYVSPELALLGTLGNWTVIPVWMGATGASGAVVAFSSFGALPAPLPVTGGCWELDILFVVLGRVKNGAFVFVFEREKVAVTTLLEMARTLKGFVVGTEKTKVTHTNVV